ncbi:hypothetical protein V8C86DRAFT_2481871 [Haematococcus lacustris]
MHGAHSAAKRSRADVIDTQGWGPTKLLSSAEGEQEQEQLGGAHVVMQSKLAALAWLREHLLQLLQQVARVQPAPASALPESSLEQSSPGRFQLWPPTAGPASKLHLGCQPVSIMSEPIASDGCRPVDASKASADSDAADGLAAATAAAAAAAATAAAATAGAAVLLTCTQTQQPHPQPQGEPAVHPGPVSMLELPQQSSMQQAQVPVTLGPNCSQALPSSLPTQPLAAAANTGDVSSCPNTRSSQPDTQPASSSQPAPLPPSAALAAAGAHSSCPQLQPCQQAGLPTTSGSPAGTSSSTPPPANSAAQPHTHAPSSPCAPSPGMPGQPGTMPHAGSSAQPLLSCPAVHTTLPADARQPPLPCSSLPTSPAAAAAGSQHSTGGSSGEAPGSEEGELSEEAEQTNRLTRWPGPGPPGHAVRRARLSHEHCAGTSPAHHHAVAQPKARKHCPQLPGPGSWPSTGSGHTYDMDGAVGLHSPVGRPLRVGSGCVESMQLHHHIGSPRAGVDRSLPLPQQTGSLGGGHSRRGMGGSQEVLGAAGSPLWDREREHGRNRDRDVLMIHDREREREGGGRSRGLEQDTDRGRERGGGGIRGVARGPGWSTVWSATPASPDRGPAGPLPALHPFAPHGLAQHSPHWSPRGPSSRPGPHSRGGTGLRHGRQ